MSNKITYGDLYLFIEKSFAKKYKREHKEAFFYTKKFLEENNVINISRIIQILSDFGAAQDIEILWNVADKVSDDTPITQDIETPIEYAIRNEYYCRWHEGMWVRCKKGDNGFMPDINEAYKKMEIYKPNKKGKN